jgi:DNA-binding HxlR family transcriptional regulator
VRPGINLHALLGKRWSTPVLLRIHEAPRRFLELKELTRGVSSRMLSVTLRELIGAGLVAKIDGIYWLTSDADPVLRWSAGAPK